MVGIFRRHPSSPGPVEMSNQWIIEDERSQTRILEKEFIISLPQFPSCQCEDASEAAFTDTFQGSLMSRTSGVYYQEHKSQS